MILADSRDHSTAVIFDTIVCECWKVVMFWGKFFSVSS